MSDTEVNLENIMNLLDDLSSDSDDDIQQSGTNQGIFTFITDLSLLLL